MVFQVSRTFNNPAASQSGFATPGAGGQTTGSPSTNTGAQAGTPREPVRPTKGILSWLFDRHSPADTQSGFPAPDGPGMHTDRNVHPEPFGGAYMQWTPDYSRGAAAYAPNFGILTANPIGAGVVALNRPQASYGVAAQYENGALWWTSQVIPTSINLQGLNSPDELAAILSQETVYAVVRTTG